MSGLANNVEDQKKQVLQQTKQIILTEKEAKEVEKRIGALRQKRQEYIIQIGAKAHQKIRLNKIVDADLSFFADHIEEIDKEIYKLAAAIEELKSASRNTNVCQKCNTIVIADSKFCGSCGTPIVIAEKAVEVLKDCENCEEAIPESAVFCPCCGQETRAV